MDDNIRVPIVQVHSDMRETWTCRGCGEWFDVVCDPSDHEVMDDGGWGEHFDNTEHEETT